MGRPVYIYGVSDREEVWGAIMYLDAPVYIWGVQCIYTAYLTGRGGGIQGAKGIYMV